MKKQKYFDYASTTPLDPKVLSAMLPYFSEKFGNPSNLYTLGRESNRAIIKATAEIAEILNCRPDEFVYTSSATEADNLAILGTARANREKGNRIIVSAIEHKGILAMSEILQKEGFEVIELPVGENGILKISDLENALTPQTILVSITSADSETGTLQPIAEIAQVIKKFREKNSTVGQLNRVTNGIAQSACNIGTGTVNFGTGTPYFHTDASQAAAHIDLNVEKLGVDMMTLSAHKLYGPKGIGGLYIRRGTPINPIIYGGGGKMRSGTENVPGIVGFSTALVLNQKRKKIEDKRIKQMRDALEKGIFKLIPKVVLNGHPTKRLPNFLNISILDVEGEAMLLMLDELGIMVGTGSACNSLSLEPSYVLSALGNPYEYVHGSIRWTLGKSNTMNDVNLF